MHSISEGENDLSVEAMTAVGTAMVITAAEVTMTEIGVTRVTNSLR